MHVKVTCKGCGAQDKALLGAGLPGRASWPVIRELPSGWLQRYEPETKAPVQTVYFCSQICEKRYGKTHRLAFVEAEEGVEA